MTTEATNTGDLCAACVAQGETNPAKKLEWHARLCLFHATFGERTRCDEIPRNLMDSSTLMDRNLPKPRQRPTAESHIPLRRPPPGIKGNDPQARPYVTPSGRQDDDGKRGAVASTPDAIALESSSLADESCGVTKKITPKTRRRVEGRTIFTVREGAPDWRDVATRYRYRESNRYVTPTLRELSEAVAEMKIIAGLSLDEIAIEFAVWGGGRRTWASNYKCLQRLSEGVWSLIAEREKKGKSIRIEVLQELSRLPAEDQLVAARTLFSPH